MPDPVKILAEIKSKGGEIETVEGAIVAGDAADINDSCTSDEATQSAEEDKEQEVDLQ